MKKFMKVGRIYALILCAMVLGLVACGSGTEEAADGTHTSSVSIKKDGSISSSIIEDFEQSYYDADSLKAMIETSITEYKARDGQAQVVLKKCEQKESVIEVLMEYGSDRDYAGFNGEDFFAGTIQAANQAGYDLNLTLQAVSDKAEKNSVSKTDLLGMGDSHIVIFEAPKTEDDEEIETIRINCYDEILYVGEGVTAVGKKSADVRLSGGYAVIVFK